VVLEKSCDLLITLAFFISLSRRCLLRLHVCFLLLSSLLDFDLERLLAQASHDLLIVHVPRGQVMLIVITEAGECIIGIDLVSRQHLHEN
jgi:hypothetical protein